MYWVVLNISPDKHILEDDSERLPEARNFDCAPICFCVWMVPAICFPGLGVSIFEEINTSIEEWA